MPERKQLQATSPVERVWIRVDPAEAIAAMRQAHRRHEHFANLFEGHARLSTSGAGNDIERATEIARRMCDFLGVSQHPMKSKLVKINPESLHDMVTNYEELAAAVSQTEFAGLLA